MEHLITISLLRYYNLFKDRTNSSESSIDEYLIIFEEEFKQQVTPIIEGIIFDFGDDDKIMENIFLKKIFEFVFEETKLKKKFFIRRCNNNNLNYINLLLTSYKLNNKN